MWLRAQPTMSYDNLLQSDPHKFWYLVPIHDVNHFGINHHDYHHVISHN